MDRLAGLAANGISPQGTHDYAKLIRPSELDAWARRAGLKLETLKGMSYNPLTRRYRLGADVSVNYITCYAGSNGS